MKSETIHQVLNSTKPPLNFYTSDGRVIYVDHPELVLITEPLIAIGSGADETGIGKQITLLDPDHIVRIDRTKRKSLHRAA